MQCYDLQKYFDSENLKDAMNSLFKIGVRGKEYNLIFEMNKENQVKIKTSVGITESFETGPNVGQGSSGGGLISAINLDYSVNRFFFTSTHEIFFHDIRLQPLLYQDDLAKFSSSRMDAQAGNDKIEACMETKLLDFHQDKSCYLLIGNKKTKELISEELELCPLTLYGKLMKNKTFEKYLGDFIHSDRVSASADATVNDRHGKMISAIKEITSIVEDCRSTTLGGLKVGLEIWELAFIPSLLNNCSTWMEIKGPTVEKLEEIQNSLYRNLLNVPFTTPKASLIWEMGGIKMKFRIMQRKLIFMNHILHLEEDSLAKQVQRVEQAQGVPGLSSEVETYIENLGLPNCFLIYIPQKKWKPLVKKAILKANETEIREDLRNIRK